MFAIADSSCDKFTVSFGCGKINNDSRTAKCQKLLKNGNE